jgi:hypothetical protein
MEAAWPSEMLLSCHITTQCCNPEDHDRNYRMIMYDELGKIWKEIALACFMVIVPLFLEGPRKTIK